MKRDQTTVEQDAIPSFKISRINTTIQALHIVLRHSMVLDLGWSTKYFDEWLLRLRGDIINDLMKNIPVDDRPLIGAELLYQLEMELGYFDESYAESQATTLATLPAEEVLFKVQSIDLFF